MLNNAKFYWGTIRKCIVGFGNLFNNIEIQRLNANGSINKSLRVPLAYAPRQKFLARIDQLPNPEERNVQITLPRMSFELLGIEYDSTRKLSFVQKNSAVNSTNNTLTTQYVPVPYNIRINLYIYSKNSDDALQIVEQILPYFNPDFNLTVKAVPELSITHDIPVILNNIDFSDSYDGEFTERRAIIWTLSFTLKTNFYGPSTKQGIIRTAKVNYWNNAPLTNSLGNYEVTTNANVYAGNTVIFLETFEGLDD
jgi:T4-like virus Myoviridae tail sheath stabiliser